MINEQKRISGNTAMQTELKLLQTTGLWPMFEIVRGLGRGNLRMLHEEKAPERNCRRRRHITSEQALPGNLTTQYVGRLNEKQTGSSTELPCKPNN